MPKHPSLCKVLIIGSGPIVIGQACEFDYSGTQAACALREEGIQVILINSNPATIMTDPAVADHVYLLPLEKDSIRKILQEHKVDAVLPTMGGQTALNLAMACEKVGMWKEYNVTLLGVDPETIACTEDREKFRQYMKKLNMPTCEGAMADSFLAGREIAQKIGFPLIIRPSYTLGGSGGGEVLHAKALDKALRIGLQTSPIHEVLLEKSIRGWKEFELELLQDEALQAIVVCSVENVDPIGIHTGDSITVSPTMTLSDTTYQCMRNMALCIIKNLPRFTGGCNIQFAVHPTDEDKLIVIEVNPRVSRSSALASKATGYPIAKIAAKLSVGYRLDELNNQITGHTSAYFEPVLDYVVVKIPRWNFDKFINADTQLSLQMKSVGEVMGVGGCFAEALLKACDSLEIRLKEVFANGAKFKKAEILQRLEKASWDRLFVLFEAFSRGITRSTIADLTGITPWFLHQIEVLVQLSSELEKYTLEKLPLALLRQAKSQGFSDERLATLLDCEAESLRQYRLVHNITRTYCMVDTCAAEFEAKTPYYYSTFLSKNESIPTQRKKVIVLGSGPNRIGQGIEFDYCCVHGLLAAKSCGYEAIMINCNPETVSTDFDVADKLYFEPLHWEYVWDIIALEKPVGVIVQLGGLTALKLAQQLHAAGIPILGTDFSFLDLAEDRGLFSDLLKAYNIPHPAYGVVTDEQSARRLAKSLGFPLLVRPSYVLGGENMKIVSNETELEEHVARLMRQMTGNRILIDHFLEDAVEAEVDAISDGQHVHIMGIMQHIEPAGIHSGDSYAVLPPYDLSDLVLQKMEQYTKLLVKALQVCGFINIQFAIQGDQVYVIEANPRASRTVPFICKAHGVPYVQHAVAMMLGHKALAELKFPPHPKGYAIKEPVFSFDKFPRVNKALGPEMRSTGESIYFIDDLKNDYFAKLYAKRNLYLSK